MTQIQETPSPKGKIQRMLPLAGALLIAVLALSYYVYSLTCPCEGIPGGILFGERVDTPVEDWSMVNEVEICQLQIAAGWRPHSINLNCWATPEGELYVGCMACEGKYWGYEVGPNERAYIRVAERVYPVTLNRIEDPAVMDQIWRSRFFKLSQRSPEPVPETPRAEGWWTYSVQSRSAT